MSATTPSADRRGAAVRVANGSSRHGSSHSWHRSVLGTSREFFAAWVAAPGVDPRPFRRAQSDLIDQAAYTSMREFRAPFVEIHEFTFFALSFVIVLHVIAVVATEVKEGGSITSAMFTGRKILSRKPEDA